MGGTGFGSIEMSIAAIYECPSCAARIPADRPLWRCDCGSHLNLTPGPGLVRGGIAADEASLWRYRAALALRDPPRVSLGEGWTPLVARRWDDAAVLFKLESQMPTGSFKDRGSAVMLNHLIEVGVGPIHEELLGQCRLLDRDLRRLGRASLPHLRAGHGAARQDRADRRLGC